MASSLALKKLLASNLLARPVYSFHPGASAARFINTNPFRDNDPLDVHPRQSDLAIRIVVPLSPTTSLINQLLLFLYGGGPALAREWSKAKKTTKAIHLSVPDDEKEEEEEVKVIMGINYKLPLSSASRRVWMNETVECIDMLKDNGKVGVWGRYTGDGLHVHVSVPGVGMEEVKVSVEENTVDIEGEPTVEIGINCL